jgi:uncharacterized protein (DUF427 family)
MNTTATSDRGARLVRVEEGTKRIRAYLGGVVVADTVKPLLVWETPRYPTYYFPVGDVRDGLLREDEGQVDSLEFGAGRRFTVITDRGEALGAAARFDASPIVELRDAIRLDWDAMDGWFEEDEEVFTHPRDPYTRVDILPSSRHVRIELEGRTLAESSTPRLLFETGLPVRYYLPKTHVRLDLLQASDAVSHCPYKGTAEYWSFDGQASHRNIAWSYPTPLPESERIAGLVSFYDHKIDLYLDGVPQARGD